MPPTLEWMGRDGLRIGTGVHLPWVSPQGAPGVLSATVAGYTKGGILLGARAVTQTSRAKITWDWIGTSRVEAIAIGHNDTQRASDLAVAWDIDALRGERALRGTPDLEAAALPYDRGAVQASIRMGEMGRQASALGALGVVARAARGAARDGAVAGPQAILGMGGALTARGSWDTSLNGAVLSDIDGQRSLPMAGASLGASLTMRPGPLEVLLRARARAQVADDAGGEPSIANAPIHASSSSPSMDASSGGSVALRLPLARSFGGPPGEAPLVHVITPGAEMRASAVMARGELFGAGASVDRQVLWMTSAGLSTSVGRYTGSALRIDMRAGVLGSGREITHTAARARAAVVGDWLSGDMEAAAAREGSSVGDILGGVSGFTILGRMRIGALDNVWLRAFAAAERGRGAGVARELGEGISSIERPARALDYLAAEGVSGGSELSIPWSRGVRTAVRADADLTAGRLLAASGAVAITHPCGCFSLMVTGGYRLGRDAPDVVLAIDLAPSKAVGLRDDSATMGRD